MSDKEGKAGKAIAKSAGTEVAPAEGEETPPSRLSWVVGWVMVPSVVIGVIFGSGVLVGVHMHDSWFTRLIVWVVELFV